MPARLYLIPTPIASDALHTLPTSTIEVVRQLDFFVVERAKTSRHFIKSLQPLRPLLEMTFLEIGETPTDFANVETAFREAVATGKSVGLMSEAGCPGIADPGAKLVMLAHQMGVEVVPLVGPSSIFLALMASGMNGQSFTFHGYLSPKRLELAADLRRLEQLAERHRQTQVFIETPYRNQMVLEVALQSLQPATSLSIAHDLTGAAQFARTLPISEWKKLKDFKIGKLPTVFSIFRGKN